MRDSWSPAPTEPDASTTSTATVWGACARTSTESGPTLWMHSRRRPRPRRPRSNQMTTTDTGTSVRKTLTVNAPIERAFDVFTNGFGTWWPPTHHIAEVDMADAILEPRVGGRWYERGIDGSECDWGSVL